MALSRFAIFCLWASQGIEPVSLVSLQLAGRFLATRSPGGGNGNSLQYSCLGNFMKKSLAGYSPWRRKEHAYTTHTHSHTHTLTLTHSHTHTLTQTHTHTHSHTLTHTLTHSLTHTHTHTHSHTHTRGWCPECDSN